MSNTISAHLVNAAQAHAAIEHAYRTLKPWLLAGHRYDLTIKPERRSNQENKLLHAMLTYISQHMDWAGQRRDVEVWKRLLTAAWCRARGEHVELLPALDGNGVDIVFRRTSELNRGECAELLEYIFAWGAQNSIEFPPDPRMIEYQTKLLEQA